MSLIIRLVAFCVCMAFAVSSYSARPWDAPIQELKKDTHIIVSAQLIALGKDKATFKINEFLLNKDTVSTIELRIQDDGWGNLQEKAFYLVAYSYVRKHPTFWDEKIIDPEGPKIVGIRGMNTMAIFSPVPATEYLLSSNHKEKSDITREFAEVMKLLEQSDDTRGQRLAVLELFFRKDFATHVTDKDILALDKILTSKKLNAQLNGFLLQAAHRLNGERDSAWLTKIDRDILAHHQPEFDLASYEPALVFAAMQGLENHADKSDLPQFARYLVSNSPTVVKEALKVMDKVDASQALAQVQKIHLSENTHSEIKRVLTAYKNQQI